MSWLIPPKPHPLLLLSPFSLLFSFIYITHSNPPLPLLLPFVLMLPCLLILCYYPLFLCYSVSSYPVSPLLILCYYPSVSLLLCLPLPCLLISCRVKNVYLSHLQGPLLCPRQGLSSMQNMPFLPLEDALLACRTCPSWRHVFKSLMVRRLR